MTKERPKVARVYKPAPRQTAVVGLSCGHMKVVLVGEAKKGKVVTCEQSHRRD